MPNIYELHGRQAKVRRIIEALDAHLGHEATAQEAKDLPQETWSAILQAAGATGSKAPSRDTCHELAEQLTFRDTARERRSGGSPIPAK